MDASSLRRDLFPSLLIVALSSCCATLVLSSCSKSPSTAIIGKWQVQGHATSTVEFKKDGIVIDHEGERMDTGKYTFTDKNHIRVEVNENTNAPTIVNCEVSFHGDIMDVTMTNPGQRTPNISHLKRIK